MAEMTIEQQKAIALARARLRAKQKAAKPADDDALSVARTATGGLIEGIPVVGPIIRGGVDRAAAATMAALTDETYDGALKRIQDMTAAEKEANPGIDTAAQVTGAVGGTIPMIMAAPAAFGGGTGSMLAKTAASTLTGTALGAGDATVRSGGDLEETKKGAMWGFGAGALGPVTGKFIGSGLSKLGQRLAALRAARNAGTSGYAIGKMASAARRDALDPAMMKTRLAELGPDAMVGDLGPNLKGQVAALANMPGEANQTVRTALEARHAGANARIGKAVDETMGRNVIPSQIDAAAAKNQEALGPAYRQAFEKAQPYDFQPIADDLDRQIKVLRGDPQRALQKVRDMLNKYGAAEVDTNPVTAFNTRQAIDGLLETEADPKVITALNDARQMIDDALTRAVPTIKEADANFAELARQRDALERGQAVLSDGRTSPRPAELATLVQEGALPQGLQIGPSAVPLRLSQGARAEVDRILGSNINDVNRLHHLIRTEGDWNRARLATLFGQEKADRLFKVLENELTFADTRNFAIGNSATAGRQEALRELGGRAGEGGFGFKDAVAAGGVRGAAVKGGEAVVRALLDGSRERGNSELANLLMSNRESVVEALSKIPGALPRLERGSDAVVRALLLGGPTSRP